MQKRCWGRSRPNQRTGRSACVKTLPKGTEAQPWMRQPSRQRGHFWKSFLSKTREAYKSTALAPMMPPAPERAESAAEPGPAEEPAAEAEELPASVPPDEEEPLAD
ncbi:unnamed protein product, partial [Symbiodinium microadriaticum]